MISSYCICYSYLFLIYIVGFFLNDTATTEIYPYCNTLALHDALPISGGRRRCAARGSHRDLLDEVPATALDRRPVETAQPVNLAQRSTEKATGDRKSTRLNSSH